MSRIFTGIKLIGKKDAFPVWLRNLSISAGLESVLSHTKNPCIIPYYGNFSTNIKKNYNNNNSCVSPVFRPFGANKTGINLLIFHFTI